MTAQRACLYIMGISGGPCKIGTTSNIDLRLAHVRREYNDKSIIVLRVFEINPRFALAAERYVHWLLRDHHFRKEWFHVSPARAATAIRKAAKMNLEIMVHELIPPLEPRGRRPKSLSIRVKTPAQRKAYRRAHPLPDK